MSRNEKSAMVRRRLLSSDRRCFFALFCNIVLTLFYFILSVYILLRDIESSILYIHLRCAKERKRGVRWLRRTCFIETAIYERLEINAEKLYFWIYSLRNVHMANATYSTA